MRDGSDLVDWPTLRQFKAELGGGFARILNYFRDDGAISVERIEAAMRTSDSAALVLPAHTLKGEARQFGAEGLALIAEKIEMTARRLVEQRRTPDELVSEVVALRPAFEATLTALEGEATPAPLPTARPTFGRRAVTTPSFGRA
ncbi:Hpt domain-containing protein [Sphingomonas sp. ID0503]|uniref:Hpt domain-containing protein n=1 Tax=Sphingomonas sp. ID0503 TaxID=3399691 RepID=UPI003AFAF0F2